jgi:hypothetical protein
MTAAGAGCQPNSILEKPAGEYISPVAIQLPFAYFPSTSQLEIAFDIRSPLLASYFGPKFPAVVTGTTSSGLAYAVYDYGDMITKYDFYRRPRDPKKVDFTALTPQKKSIVRNLNFELDPRETGWCAIYDGYIEVPGDNVYTINVRPFSSLRLFIDDHLVINTVDDMTYNWKGCAVALRKGKHKFVLSTIAYTIERIHPELPPDLLHISTSGMPRQPIPDIWFMHSADQLDNPSLPVESGEASVTVPDVLRRLESITVEVLSVEGNKVMFSETMNLNKDGRAQERFSIPDLPDGEYEVDYIVAGLRIRQPMTFCRIHFPFEGNNLGLEHKIYPPFERLNVRGVDVTMVDRTYTMNEFGAFDQVISRGREILAEPVRLVCETADGSENWLVSNRPRGYTPYPDEAVFTGSAVCDALEVKTRTIIQEDGCARIEMQLCPGPENKPVRRLWLEIVMTDKEAPMFTYVNAGCYTLRSYYGGKIPRGGKITWDITGETNFLRAPSMWQAGQGTDDGVVFDATQDADTASNFLPYIWMGAAERGLAWFTGENRNYINDGKQPMMELSREGDKVVLRIYFILQPAVINSPRTITYGLVASPTKPLRPDWRTHEVPGGGGLPVIAWGGYRCADKYPDNHDFSIVDKLQEARRNHQPVDTAFFRFKDRNRYYLDWGVYETPWLRFVTSSYTQNCTYFEEHFIQSRDIEWEIFQDEWAHMLFTRFQPCDANGMWLGFNYYGCTARSYRDFVLYYANEWLKRGISLYFDNTFPKWDDNPYSNGFYDGRSVSIWSQRDYYRRIYKLMSYYNESGSEWPLDFTLHMTNSPTIPINTWCTSFLDLEQPYRRSADGTELPFPPDYILAMTLGRTVGVIPHIMYPLRNIGGWTNRGGTMNEHQYLSNWGMSVVHELGVYGNRRAGTLANKYNEIYHDYGYPGDVTIHNYWEDEPYLTVSNDSLCWIALTRTTQHSCLIVLQSYAPEAITATVNVPGCKILMDAETGEIFVPGKEGQISITLTDDYGTKLLLAGDSRDDLPEETIKQTIE